MPNCKKSNQSIDSVVVFWPGFAEAHCLECDQMIVVDTKTNMYIEHEIESENENE